MCDCGGRSRRKGTGGERKRDRVTRTQSEESRIVSSPAWFRLAGLMSRTDLVEPAWVRDGTCGLSWGRELGLGLEHPACHAPTAQSVPPLLARVFCSLLSALSCFDILNQLSLPSASSCDIVSWYPPSQFPDHCLFLLTDATPTSGLFTSLPDVLPWTMYLGFPEVTW